MNELLTVIVPVYNSEKYLSHCIQSISEQTYSNLQIVLVNDGSNDSSAEICNTWRENDHRIEVIHKNNGGASSARNSGIIAATGDYIVFVDSDDYVLPRYCEDLIIEKRKNSSELVICGYQYLNNGILGKQVLIDDIDVEFIEKERFFEIYSRRLLNSPWCKLYDKRIIEKNGILFDEGMRDGEDLFFNLQYLQNMHGRIAICNKANYIYRNDNTASVTNNFIPDMWTQKKKCFSKMKELLVLYNMFELFQEDYYGCYLDAIVRVLNNNMLGTNPKKTRERIKDNTIILRDPECKKTLKYGKCQTIPLYYRYLLRCKSYYPLYLYNTLLNVLKRKR